MDEEFFFLFLKTVIWKQQKTKRFTIFKTIKKSHVDNNNNNNKRKQFNVMQSKQTNIITALCCSINKQIQFKIFVS